MVEKGMLGGVELSSTAVALGVGVWGEGLLRSGDSGAFKEEGRLLKVTYSCILTGETGTD